MIVVSSVLTWEGAFAGVDDLEVQVLVLAARHPEVEPLKMSGIICGQSDTK